MEDSQFQEPLFSGKVKFLIYSSLLIILILLGLFLAPNFMSSSQYQAHLVAELERLTGKQVKIGEQVNISINPLLDSFTINANNLTITDFHKDGDINFISSNSLKASIPLHKLLFKDLQVTDVALDGANINLLDIFKAQEKLQFVHNLDSIKLTNSQITLKNNKYSDLALNIDINTNGSISLVGDATDQDKHINIIAKISSAKAQGDRDIEIDVVRDISTAIFKGSLTAGNGIQLAAVIRLAEPSILLRSSANFLPFMSGVIPDKFSEVVNVTFDLASLEKQVNIKNIKIVSSHTNGNGEIKFNLNDQLDLNAQLDFDNIDLTEILKSTPKKPNNIYDANLIGEDYVANNPGQANVSDFIDISLLDKLNLTLALNAKNIKFSNTNLQDFGLNIDVQQGKFGQSEVHFAFVNDKDKASIKINDINLQKIDNTNIILANFMSGGNNINEVFRLFNLQDYISLSNENLNYALTSKVVFAPLEMSIFNIAGQIGLKGNISGNIATKQDNSTGLTDYQIDLSFNGLKLDNLAMPLLKEQLSSMLTKSNEDNYFSYFRWFRALPANYNIKLNFADTEFNNEKITSLSNSIILQPGSMSVTGKIDSSFAKLDYNMKLMAQAIKPSLTVQINGDNLDYTAFAKLFGAVVAKNQFAKQEDQVSDNSVWSDKNIDIFRINKYNAKFDIQLKNLSIATKSMNNFGFAGHTSNDIFYIDNLYGGIYAGQFSIRGNISFFDSMLYQASFTGGSITLQDLLANISPNLNIVSGPIDITGSIVTQGNNAKDLVANLNSSISFASGGLIINNIDADAIVDIALKRKAIAKDQAISDVTKNLNKGATSVRAVSGTITGTKGILETKDVSFKSRFTGAVYAAYVDLNNMTLSSNANFAFISMQGDKIINYNILQSGNLSQDLQNSIDDSALLDYIRHQYNIEPAKKTIKEKAKVQPNNNHANESYLYRLLEGNNNAPQN